MHLDSSSGLFFSQIEVLPDVQSFFTIPCGSHLQHGRLNALYRRIQQESVAYSRMTPNLNITWRRFLLFVMLIPMLKWISETLRQIDGLENARSGSHLMNLIWTKSYSYQLKYCSLLDSISEEVNVQPVRRAAAVWHSWSFCSIWFQLHWNWTLADFHHHPYDWVQRPAKHKHY